MTLIGKNYAEYGQLLADNFIRLLENASNTTAPPAPITGQLWWDKTTTLLKVYSGTGWKNIGGATASASQPTPSIVGDLWFNTANQQLYVCSVAGAPGTFIVVGAAVNNPGNITFAVANSVIETVASTGVYVTGLITATGNVTGGNIATSGLATVTGNITGGNIRTAGLVSAAGTVTGSSLLGSVVSASGNVTGGNVLTGGLVSAGGTVTGSSLLGSVVSASGNVTGGNVLTGGLISAAGTVNGSSLLGSVVSASGNVTGGNILTAGLISATGTVTGSFFIGDGSQLTGIGSTSIQNGTSNVRVVSSGGNVTIGIGGTSNVAVYATTGEYVTGVISANGNVTGGNVLTGGFISATGTVTGSSLLGSVVSVSGAITGSQFNGSGAGLTSIPGGNVSKVANATYSDSAGAATTAGSATTAGTANSVAGANVSGTVANATYALSAGSATTAGTVTTGTQSNITGVGTLTSLSVTGNITGGNVLGGANVNATTHTGSTVSVSGNVNGGNIVTLGFVSAAGTITGATISSTGDVLAVRTSASGNVTGGNVLTGGLISAGGNITGGNVLTGGLISAGGNVTGSSFSTTGNVTISGSGRLVAAGIAKTNYNFISTVLNGLTYYPDGNTRVLVFTGTGGTIDLYGLGGGTSNLVNEHYIINNCSGTLTIRASATAIGIIPPGATGTATTNRYPVDSAASWSLSIGFNSNISVTGTVTGSSFSGAGTGLTGTASSLTVGSAGTAGTVTTAAQPSITSVGVLTSLSTTGNVTTTSRLVATGIEFTNYAWTSIATTGGLTNLPGGVNQQKRVFVFTGTSNQYVGMPLTTYGTVVPEFYIINNSTGTLFIEDAVGFSIATVPSGASCTVTGTFTSTPGASYWRASIGASNFALGCGGQTWQTPSRAVNVTYTNSTSRPIQVSISLNNLTSSTYFNFYVDSVLVSSQGRNGNLNNAAAVFAVIPVGSTYLLDTAVGGNQFSLATWAELR
jgi:hypothetical protein